MSKQEDYKNLVNNFKQHKFDDSIIHPFDLKHDKKEHLNAWAYWHGDLEAKILLIGQDFGDEDYYNNNNGIDDHNNPTNNSLIKLFDKIDIKIGSSDNPNKYVKLYFTNAFLGVKKGGMAAPIKRKWYKETAIKFTKPLIEIIQPEIIIAMGSRAYDVLSIIYNINKKTMKEIISERKPLDIKNEKVKIFVVYHCSTLGQANRKMEQQYEDWIKIKKHL